MLGFSPLAAAPLGDDGDVAVVYEFVAVGVVTGQPDLGNPLVTQDHDLVAQDIVTGQPVLGNPTVTQDHDLVAQDIFAGQPSIPENQLEIISNIAANDIVSGTPVLGQPTLLEVFGAIGLQTGNPVVSDATLQQDHNLVADNLNTAPTDVPTISLNVVSDLLVEGILTGSPILGQPNFNNFTSLLANDIVFGPVIVPTVFFFEGTQFTTLVTGTFTGVVQVSGGFIGDVNVPANWNVQREINTIWRRVDVH